MIGKLKGIIDSYGEDYVILDVGGVGYQVQCSARTLQELPASGQPTEYRCVRSGDFATPNPPVFVGISPMP